jgi:hypothetical protein
VTTGTAVANSLWIASSLPAARRFASALRHPAESQANILQRLLRTHATSAYGNQHDFPAIHSTTDFARRVPLTAYDAYAPWIDRIRKGETSVLSSDRVTHLAPTSGSSGGAKLIPFGASLQRGFDVAVGAWMCDLVQQRPRLLGGCAYWSISPASPGPPVSDSQVPIGFADDADYLGGSAAWLVRRVLAVPPDVRHVRHEQAFWRLTLLALLRRPDLRLISVWHPSFIELMVAEAEAAWPELLDAVANGTNPWDFALPAASVRRWRVDPDRKRAAELRRLGAMNWQQWWPDLQVLSCWGEQAAEPGWRQLVRQLPSVLVQPKGLLATEGVVTIPWRNTTPLAVTSHYFEFISEDGDVIGAHQLERGRTYEVVITNGGGLWRYRLGDVVTCTGHVHATPLLRFLGRAGHVSDLRGEKLSESFVATVLSQLQHDDTRPAYVALRPRDAGGSAGYELLVASDWSTLTDGELSDRIEGALLVNPHYAIARRLGQLTPLRVVRVDPDSASSQLRNSSIRLGDTKPEVLLPLAR